MKKTNAARFLDGLKNDYRLCEYEFDESDLRAESVAVTVSKITKN
jgi:Cys-tRNA(Pro)/Cys-tRNA(Cys) deacylase